MDEEFHVWKSRSVADSGLTLGGGAKYTARVSAREIFCATPTFDVIFKVVA